MSKTYIAHEVNGYYAEDVKMTVDRRLRYAPYAQAGWRERKLGARESVLEMYSYSSLIFTASFDCGALCDISTRDSCAAMDYSRTTSAQVTKALRELGISDRAIWALKRFFSAGGVTVVLLGSGDWVDASTGEVVV